MAKLVLKASRCVNWTLGFIFLLAIFGMPFACRRDSRSRIIREKMALAKNGNPDAIVFMANVYRSGGWGITPDVNESVFWDKRGAELKIPESQFAMANRFEEGIGVELNNARAIEMYRLCAQNGVGRWQTEAQAALGLRLLEHGKSIAGSGGARLWLLKAALGGNQPALFNMAAYYIERPEKELGELGRIMLEVAAERGLAQAQYRYGLYYSDGRFVSPNFSTAVRWLKLASDQKYVRAMMELGKYTMIGKGVERDEQGGARLISAAAEMGDLEAQAELAKLYRFGFGVARDDKKCKIWLNKWADGSIAEAEKNFMENKISKKQYEDIRQAVASVKAIQ